MPAAKTRAVSHQYHIQSSPQKVFAALTDPRLLVKWLADHAEISARKGGRYSFGWKDGPTHIGTITDFVPGTSVTFAWRWPGETLAGTEFKLSVEPKGNGTILSVEHSGFPRLAKWVDLYAGAEWGWTYFAMNLKSVLESGHDLRSQYDG